MKTRQPLRSAIFAAALVLPISFIGCAQAAGFFDAIGSIFGADPEPPRYQPAPGGYYGRDEGGLGITVRPRRQRPRRERPVVRKEVPGPARAANLDPSSNPNWYLDDPTLKVGDIVVLKGEVLVFQGGRVPYAREDFTSLASSRLSKEERARVGAMAGLPPDSASVAPTDRTRVTAATE